MHTFQMESGDHAKTVDKTNISKHQGGRIVM